MVGVRACQALEVAQHLMLALVQVEDGLLQILACTREWTQIRLHL